MKINQETVTFDDIGHWETQAAEALAALGYSAAEAAATTKIGIPGRL